MDTFSTILTKVNSVNLQFKDQIQLKQQIVNDQLEKFVKFVHPRISDATNLIEFIEVINRRSHFRYYNYGSYFMRLNVNTGSKKYYKVS